MPDTYPILALRSTAIFPENILPLAIGRERSMELILKAQADFNSEDLIVLVSQRDAAIAEPDREDLYDVGTLCKILKVVRVKKDHLKVIVQGVNRVRILSLDQSGEYDVGEVEDFPLLITNSDAEQEFYEKLKESTQDLAATLPSIPKEAGTLLTDLQEPERVCYFLVGNMDLEVHVSQTLLEVESLEELMIKIHSVLIAQVHASDMASKIQKNIDNDTAKVQKEWYLRQQLKAIKKELGESDALEDLEVKIEDAELPSDVYLACMKQLERVRGMQSSSAEYNVTLSYIETILEIPWSTQSLDNTDLDHASKILEEDHQGLSKVKTRILEYLAVRKLKDDMKGPILCLSGPPGVGKTSMSKSIARALGREFIRVSLGGVQDESEIRGHRRTYVGAMPGRLAKAMIKAGTNNPVILLDEIDKLAKNMRGDPQAAMLEVLDPEQNDSFSDHYVELPLDLSQVLFIATANQLGNITGPLRDRMEIIEVPSYTQSEKFDIATKHLIPKQIVRHGIKEPNITFDEEALKEVIESYTREAGVRNLERRIADLCRSAAVKVAHTKEDERDNVHVEIDSSYVTEKLGPARYISDRAQRLSSTGVATGLAWTSVGGDVLFVEAAKMSGKGKFKCTGQLGDVMQESVSTAITYIKSHALELGLPPQIFDKQDFHIHFPAGGIPKDGPSAGVTIFSALLSLLTDVKVNKDVAMTGEISLRGNVLPVGGIKEKLTAAHRAGIKKVLIPKLCMKDLVDLHPEVRAGLEIVPITHARELPPHVLESYVPPVPVESSSEDPDEALN